MPLTTSNRPEPETARDYCDRGRTRLHEGDHQGAIKDFKTAIRRDWENGYYKYCLMHVRAIEQDLVGAIKDCQWMLTLLETVPECKARSVVQAKVGTMLDYFQSQVQAILTLAGPELLQRFRCYNRSGCPDNEGCAVMMRENPLIYEINAWVWLNDLSRRYGHTITFSTVPAEVVDELASWKFDAIWLMGVWERSPHGREIALHHPDLQLEYDRALPGHTPDQVAGSPYAVRRYAVDPHLGGRDGLAALRRQFSEYGISLILDYVPNHVAVDHHWAVDCPDCLVRGTAQDAKLRPGSYFTAVEGQEPRPIFAHGRDPYFPAWSDTAQVDAFSPTARQQARETVLDIASQCDGVRCDMAMLLVNRIFSQTWAQYIQQRYKNHTPATEFWQEIIPAVKAQHPQFIFMAEVYWDMEFELQNLGFDYTYDKRLYDRLRNEDVALVRDHLLAPLSYQRKMVRFIENHDEPRAITALGEQRSRAAAVLTLALPGLKLTHDGQFEGRRIKLPVQLGQRHHEAIHAELLAFYQGLIHEIQEAPYHDGIYMMLASNPMFSHDTSYQKIIAFAWASPNDQEWRIVVVNFSDQPATGRLILPNPAFAGEQVWRFTNVLHPADSMLHMGDDLLTSGLPIELAAYGTRIFHAAISV